MKMNKLVFDQDTQRGFELTPIEDTVPNIEKMLVEAMRNDVLLASCTYYRESEDTEKLSATIVVEDEFYYNVSMTNNGIDMNIADDCYQVNFEHHTGDIWNEAGGQPDNFMTFLRTNEVDTVYLIGNNYSGNILNTYIGLTKRKYNVVLVADAVNNLTEFIAQKFEIFGERFGNLRVLTTEEAIGELNE